MKELEQGRTGEGYKTLLKQARPATVGQLQEKLTLDTDKINTKPQATNVLKNQAQALENLLLKEGSVATSELEKKLTGLKRYVKKYKNLTEDNWLKVFKDKFVVQDGIVRLKNNPSSSSSQALAPPAPAPKAKLKGADYFKALKQIYGSKPVYK